MSKNLIIPFSPTLIGGQTIKISGSKSQSNRLLLLMALLGDGLSIENLSDSDDTRFLQAMLSADQGVADVHHAGTAMRFGTAFAACKQGLEIVLTGSKRMKERPIKALVDALRSLGADIEYVENEGFPPLKIRGKRIEGGDCEVDAGISSQFITALLLCAPTFERGISLCLKGKIVSMPYIRMTLETLKQVGVECSVDGDVIRVEPFSGVMDRVVRVESDWSSASYFFSLCAIGRKTINLECFEKDSLQGDSALADIYRFFGVECVFDKGRICLSPIDDFTAPERIDLNMENTPDIAQTVAVTMAMMGIRGRLDGLGTLRVKETDRIAAMSEELKKFGVKTLCGDDWMEISGFEEAEKDIFLKTYNDHRMAMAFAPMCFKQGFEVEDADVVSKSYVRFWEDFAVITDTRIYGN